MTTITMHETDGTAREANFRVITKRDETAIGLATLEVDGETFRVPTVVYDDGTVISVTDWQGPDMDDDEIVEEATNPTWAHHWVGQGGEAVAILDGLPRIVG
ncbi:MAG: hypothetical protein EP336_09425 [Rhodobacteraceae bacterium]|nr:MAG: hypothetical protein EP336_09425 [Paracoccaceae bacterium]